MVEGLGGWSGNHQIFQVPFQIHWPKAHRNKVSFLCPFVNMLSSLTLLISWPELKYHNKQGTHVIWAPYFPKQSQ